MKIKKFNENLEEDFVNVYYVYDKQNPYTLFLIINKKHHLS